MLVTLNDGKTKMKHYVCLHIHILSHSFVRSFAQVKAFARLIQLLISMCLYPAHDNKNENERMKEQTQYEHNAE